MRSIHDIEDFNNIMLLYIIWHQIGPEYAFKESFVFVFSWKQNTPVLLCIVLGQICQHQHANVFSRNLYHNLALWSMIKVLTLFHFRYILCGVDVSVLVLTGQSWHDLRRMYQRKWIAVSAQCYPIDLHYLHEYIYCILIMILWYGSWRATFTFIAECVRAEDNAKDRRGPIFNCDKITGNYLPRQIHGSTVYCADPEGNRVSKYFHIGSENIPC